MRNGFFFLCFLLFACEAYGQDSLEKKIDISAITFVQDHLGFFFSHRIVNKADINHQSGPYSIGSSVQAGVEGGLNYHVNFNRHFSLLLGLHATIHLRNYILFIPKEDFQPHAPYDFDEDGGYSKSADLYFSIPILLEKRWFTKEKDFWNLAAGCSMNYHPAEMGEGSTHLMIDGNGNPFELLRIDLNIGNNSKRWFDYQLCGGYGWILENNNLIKLNFIANLSTTRLVKGSYHINVPGKPDSFGNYSVKYSYAGISAQYLFTGTKKVIARQKKEKVFVGY